ncbi:MAG: tRNA pseudouridine(55) synthase TruB [Desulfobacteraceae bacterium]|nr:tRNA pseudouridine(55) synthase TruB [Desulfobacteraceae bacterium]MDH3573875.1 tRNA pseudouridine(55) synthase TruB [Desulfobacteraceae bacterium]MDH3721255.1 tRNA pseudouridine(55) synthase TruB [Desulfobacteraceae bacterium]MDH3836883.1 tRNA pseudouridine(55) synthase TruB [Desulfobacteraceae bacterium]MDH3872944.1 tRNA pseudouridine(55) synthase TruB [Desulfobacteraceae bacterium]
MPNIERQELSGIIVVDKPPGITSAKVVARVKKLLKARKAGHTGTLDPFATGVLVCCINRATKLSRFFLHGEKKYEAVLHLGVETDTQDSTGTVTAICNTVEFSNKTIQSAFRKFEGTIKQLPPIFSALKHKGVPLYKLARSKKPVQKPARQVSIITLKILEVHLPTIRFEVFCSAGTYIRTLCADIGASLGCGGHLKELRRTESSGFTIADAVTLEELEDLTFLKKSSDRIINMSNALKGIPEHIADNVLVKKIMHGHIITKNDFMFETINASEDFIKIVDTDKKLVAILKYSNDKNRYDYCCVFNT